MLSWNYLKPLLTGGRSTEIMKISELKIELRNRQGGGGKTERKYLDFIVDGRPILDHLDSNSSDFIGRLGWGPIKEHNAGIEHLLLKRPPDSPSNRVLILLCPECGDIGCGAFSVKIEKDENYFIWKDIVFENDCEDAPVESFIGVGPFYFNKQSYFSELNKHRLYE